MCMCVNHELVRTITRRSFKLRSPNLDQWCKTRWFRSLLFLGWSTLSFKVKFNLKSNITPFWACPHHHSSTVQARITRFGPRMHLRTVKVPIDFGLDWLWCSPWFSILKPIFLPNVFAQFLYYIYWDLSLVNISETIADDRSNQFGLLTERTFCRKLSRNISVDSRYCNRFINTGRPIFSLNHSGASAATVQSRHHSGSCMRGVTLALSGPPNLWPESDHRYVMLLLFRQPITSPKLDLTSVRSVVLVQTQLQSI